MLKVEGGYLISSGGEKMSSMLSPQNTVLEKEEERNEASVGFHLLSSGSDENMPYNMNCLELSTDVEDSRTGYILSMWDECAEKKEFKKKERGGKKELLVQPGNILLRIAHPRPQDEILMYNLFICGLTSFQH